MVAKVLGAKVKLADADFWADDRRQPADAAEVDETDLPQILQVPLKGDGGILQSVPSLAAGL